MRRTPWLLALIVVPTSAYFILAESAQNHLVSVYQDCACWPGMTPWAYALDVLGFFLLLNVLLVPAWFSGVLSRRGMAFLVAVELVAYGWVFTIGVANLSTTHLPPDWAALNLVLVVVAYGSGYLLEMAGGSMVRRKEGVDDLRAWPERAREANAES